MDTLAELQRDIHTALQMWHNSGSETSPLAHLQWFQQVQIQAGSNTRQATNKLLLEALEILAVTHRLEADLLRQRFLDMEMMHVVANRLNMGESTAYRKQQEALQQLALVIQEKETQLKAAYQAQLEKELQLPPPVELFGVAALLDKLQKTVLSDERVWLLSIEGLGGLGKTALANALIRRPALAGRFQKLVWVSAKQHEFLPDLERDKLTQPALTGDALIEALLEQVAHPAVLAQPSPQKEVLLTGLLKDTPHFIVIDNLETVTDYQALLPLLRRLANPAKFLLTSRHSLHTQADVFCCSLAELDQTESLRFIRYEAGIRGLSMLANASEADLLRIHEVVGGNPLAIKLVVGQLSVLPLAQVLDNLKQARGQKIGALYSYIYWQTWQMLTHHSRQTLLILPLTQEATLEQLLAVSGLELTQLSEALEQLAALSLIQIGGNLAERRYTIHRLTETFLLQEALKWQAST